MFNVNWSCLFSALLQSKTATCTALLISVQLTVTGGTVELLAPSQALTVDNSYVSTGDVERFIFLLSLKKKEKEMD